MFLALLSSYSRMTSKTDSHAAISPCLVDVYSILYEVNDERQKSNMLQLAELDFENEIFRNEDIFITKIIIPIITTTILS